ncbi:MAG: serine hydrolase, partial [Bacteroidota bacterium]
TLKDQLIYEQAVQNANQSNNALLIKSQQPIPNSEIETYGFGLKLENRLNRTAVHHDGATYGYHSQTIRFPKEKLTIFIMSNNGNIRSDLIADEIASVFLPAIEGKEKYDSRFYESLSSTKKPQVLGQYNYPNGGNLVRIIKKEGKTYWKEGNYNALEMTPQGENKYAFVYDPTLKVVFYENEMVEFYSSGKTMRYKRNEDLPASLADLEGFVGEYYSSELEVGFELKLTADHKLNLLFSNRERVLEVEVLNQNELLANNFRMRIQRDPFDRVTDVLLSLGRAKNNRFKKKTNLKFQPKIETEHGSIQVTTIGSKNNDKSDILLTKNYPNGNEIWYKQFGGSSYDKASSILATEDGYLIIGSTSSYGNGNYDMLVIKTDKKGKKQWQNTYGGFYNEYGYTAEETKDGYLIKGTKQNCTSNSDVFNRKCTTNVWFVSIDKKGKEISSKILEKI